MSLQFDNKISLGHIISIALILFGGVTAYTDLRSSQVQLSSEVEAMFRAAEQRELRVRNVEIAQATQSSDLRAILSSITRIENQFNKMQDRK